MTTDFFTSLGQATARHLAKRLDEPRTRTAVQNFADQAITRHLSGGRGQAHDATIAMNPRGSQPDNGGSQGLEDVSVEDAIAFVGQLLQNFQGSDFDAFARAIAALLDGIDPDDDGRPENQVAAVTTGGDRGFRGGRRGSARDGTAPNGLNGPRSSAAAMDAAIRNAEGEARRLRIQRANAQSAHTEDFFTRFPDAARIRFS